MGGKHSKSGAAPSRAHGKTVIEIVSGANMPKMDVVSGSDCYARVSIIVEGTVAKKGCIPKVIEHGGKTLARYNQTDPLWRSYKTFRTVPQNSDILRIEVIDADHVSRDDKIGEAWIPFSELKSVPLGDVYEKELNLIHTKKTVGSGLTPSVKVRLISITDAKDLVSEQRTFFLIRHGESKWNKAQSKRDVKGLVQQHDHELTSDGIKDAKDLNALWKAAAETTNEDAVVQERVNKFLNAKLSISSPLTRAVQTALLAMHGHPSTAEHGLLLLRNLREVKNAGSFDSVGSKSGDDIAPHVKTKLEEASEDGVMVDIHPNDAVGVWWNYLLDKENDKDTAIRLDGVLNFLKYDSAVPDDAATVLAGHSHFFRAMMKRHIGKEFRKRDPAWANTLSKEKLRNGACLCVTFEWSPECVGMGAIPVVVDAKLMFGTTLANGDTGSSAL
eukprot:m.211237 g.211237  ORF g.211237 m.211237 type:complete len:444 (-) comp19025_c0_seq1:489-1820(-)